MEAYSSVSMLIFVITYFLQVSSDPCTTYKNLDDDWRNIKNGENYARKCDRDTLTTDWYRFTDGAGNKMADSCVNGGSGYYCGTHGGMWLNGSHPRLEDGVVNRTVCYAWNWECCNPRLAPPLSIEVKKCDQGYYVYKLRPPPACLLAFCGEDDTSDPCLSSSCTGCHACIVNDGHAMCVKQECVDPTSITLNVTVLSATSLRVVWQNMDPNDEITKYIIEYKLTKHIACGTVLNNSYQTVQINANGSMHVQDIVNLEEYAEYSLRMKAYTSLRVGNYSTLVVNTSSAAPGSSPGAIRISNITARHFIATWNDVPCAQRNGELVNFTYEVVEKENGLPIQGDPLVAASDQTQGLITGLKPYTTYGVRAQFCNKIGCSDYGAEGSVQTDEDKPGESFNVTSMSFSDTSLKVSWMDPKVKNGEIIKYSVQIWLKGNSSTSKTKLIEEEFSTEFILLRPYSVYIIQVNAAIIKGFGPWEQTEGSTKEGKPSAPVNIRHTSRTDTTLVLLWEEPLHPRGIITKYKMLCRPINSIIGIFSVDPIEAGIENVLPNSELSALIAPLVGATQYSCSISGYTSAGYGTEAAYITWTGPPKLTDSELSTIKPEVNKTSVTGTTITMKLNPFKSSDGINITEYHVVVDRQENYREHRDSLGKTKESQLYDYDNAEEEGLIYYITASFTSHHIPDDGTKFTVGDGKKYGSYFNVPLEEGVTYNLWYGILRSVDGVTTASYVSATDAPILAIQPVDPDETLIYKITLGSIIPVFLVSIVGIIVFLRRYFGKRHDRHESNQLKSVSHPQQQQKRSDIHLTDISTADVAYRNHGVTIQTNENQVGNMYQRLQGTIGRRLESDYETPEQENHYEEIH